MNARKMFAVLTLAIAMFFTVAANAQTKPAPKTEKKPMTKTEKPMPKKHGHKKSHHKKSHKKSHGKKSGGTGTTKPAPKKS